MGWGWGEGMPCHYTTAGKDMPEAASIAQMRQGLTSAATAPCLRYVVVEEVFGGSGGMTIHPRYAPVHASTVVAMDEEEEGGDEEEEGRQRQQLEMTIARGGNKTGDDNDGGGGEEMQTSVAK